MAFVFPVLITIHVLVCILMVVVVLMQRPRSEGLGAAFGGGLTDNVFGSQTTQVLGRFTTWLATGFFGITLLLSILTAKFSAAPTTIQEKLMAEPVPEVAAEPTEATGTPAEEEASGTMEAAEPSSTPVAETEQPAAVEPSVTETVVEEVVVESVAGEEAVETVEVTTTPEAAIPSEAVEPPAEPVAPAPAE
jgi:preprotein translocase subunit SecG